MTVMNEASSELSAKLLATENIAVMRARVRTASFDIKNRVLTLPQWKEMTPAIEGMLIGHEVGHALYTTDEYMDPLKENSALQEYMNVLEDVRIEKLMKRKYPGIRKQMNQGYKELNDKDFFGISKIQDLSSLNLIDRINLYFKAGYQCGVKFNADEKIYVERAEKTESIEEIVALANEVYAFSKEQIEKRKREQLESAPNEDLEDLLDELQQDADADADIDALGDPFDDIDDFEQQPNELADVSDYRASRAPMTEEERKEKIEERIESEVAKDLESITEKSFKEKLEELADESTQYVYYRLDERRVIDPVVGYKTVLSETTEIDTMISETERKEIDKFKIESNRVVNYLIKEFEMRKSATLYKRATTSKIGSLDMKKIWSYKLQDDLFKRITSIPKGKNHGMIFMLDWSGSMDGVLDDTIKQVVNLAMFCQRAQIPYQVLAFTTQYNLFKDEYSKGKWYAMRQEFLSTPDLLGNAINADFALIELFSNKMSNVEFNTMVKRTFRHYYMRQINGYETGGTPLNESLSYMLTHIPEFMKKNNVEKMSLITLTDGEGGSLCTSRGQYLSERTYDSVTHKQVAIKNFLKDPVTKKDYKIDRSGTTQTEAILRMIKDRYNINSVGFYICRNARRDLTCAVHNNLSGYDGSTDNMIDSMRRQFKENGFASIKNTGRDDLFIVPQNKLVVEEGEIVVEEKQNARQIARMFTKQMAGRTTSRVLLNQFIGYVA
jgi:hypothetical protein